MENVHLRARRHINASFYFWTPKTAMYGSSVYATVQAQKQIQNYKILHKKTKQSFQNITATLLLISLI